MGRVFSRDGDVGFELFAEGDDVEVSGFAASSGFEFEFEFEFESGDVALRRLNMAMRLWRI